MQRAYYESSLQDFLQQDENLILGILARNNEYTLEDLQRNAWLAEIRILKSQLAVLKTGIRKNQNLLPVIRTCRFLRSTSCTQSFYW